MKVTIDGVEYTPARQPRTDRPVPIWQLMARARKAHKMTLEQVAKAAGVSIGAVSNAESGVSGLLTACRLARVYGLDGNDVIDSILRMES